MIKHLYLHVPFCNTICAYCDFCHVVKKDEDVSKWLDALKYEFEDKEIDKELETIYIGGGTPTSLKASDLETILQLLEPYSRYVKEYTIEINPESLDEEKVQLLSKYKVNRVSIGLQSTDEKLLKLMNRHHSKEDVTKSIELLRKYGIDNISLDAMYSLPNQTLDSFKETLEYIVDQDVPHISLYSLTIEENSVFGKKGYDHLDEDTEADMYDKAISFLTSKGYKQYEISNFCKNGYESKHNLGYWHYEDFYGISMGASGKQENTRYDNTRSFDKYYEHLYVDTITTLTKEDMMFEHLMMSLRLKDGLDLNEFHNRYNVTFDSVYLNQKNGAIEKGLLVEDNNHLKCTEYGFKICNTVIEMFMN